MINEYDDVGVVVGRRFIDGFEQLLSHNLYLRVVATCLTTALLLVHVIWF